MLRVGFVQNSPVFGDVAGNRRRLLEQVLGLEADLVVLPELCQTGYVFISREEAYSLAEPIPDGPTSQALARLAADAGVTLVAGLSELAGDVIFNAAAVFDPSGHRLTYRKIHLFGEEKLWFEAGDRPFEVIDVAGVRVGVMVCYDWRFPEAARSLALLGAEVITHPANLVLPFCQEVMRARCIENRLFAVTANRVGTDARPDGRSVTFTGRSQVVDPDGEVLIRAAEDEEATAMITIDPVLAQRKSFNDGLNHVLTDRRPELYRPLFASPDD